MVRNFFPALFIRILLVVTLAVNGLAFVRETSSATAADYDVDTLFRPDINGFQFSNYNNKICKDETCTQTESVENLTTQEMQRLFGNQICRTIDEKGKCQPYKVAESWMDKLNQAMGTGHCEGMAVLATLLYAGMIDPLQFGSANINELKLEGNPLLQREIAYWYTTQSYMNDYAIINDPVSQLKYLIKSYREDPSFLIPIGIYQPDQTDGHTVLAYAIDAKENHIYQIMVYDSNFPNEERYISVSVADNSWQYETQFAEEEKPTVYAGSEMNNPFQLIPVNQRLGKFDCDFCPRATGKENDGTNAQNTNPQDTTGTSRININADLNIYIENAEGQKSGYDWKNNTNYRQVPDLELRRVFGQSSAKFVNDISYYLWVNNPNSRDWASFDINIISPGSVLNLTNMLESYEYPNIIYRPFKPDKFNAPPFETFEVVAYPNHLPGIEFIISNSIGEFRVKYQITFDGDADLSTKIDFLIFHDFSTGQLGIEIHPAKEDEADLFANAVFKVDGDFYSYVDGNEQHISTGDIFPLSMSIKGGLYFDYFTWLLEKEFTISNLEDSNILYEIKN